MKNWTVPIAVVSLLMVLGSSVAGEVKIRTMDTPAARGAWRTWQKDLNAVTVDAAHGESLGVPVAFPQVKQIWCGSRQRPAPLARVFSDPKRPAISWETFQFDLYLPPESLPDGIRIQCRLLLQNKDGLWFEGIGRRRKADGGWVSARALQPGWNTVQVDLSLDSADMTPHGHRMRWSRFFLTQIAAIGFSLQGDRPYNATVAIDNITTWAAADDAFPPLAVYDFAPDAEEVPCYGRTELSFLVNRPLFNPFEQDEIKVDAIFKAPGGGAEVRVPAFYYQPYLREKGKDDDNRNFKDRYTPVGRGLFKVRFTPRQAGVYKYHLEVTYRSPIRRVEEKLVTEARELKVTPGEDKGFVRISKKDRRYFEFEDGSFFYPLGHSFRSPIDLRHVKRILRPYYPTAPVPKDRGLRIYEEQLPKMQKAGLNCFEVWMASWWLGIEWTGRWKNYHGLGVYNMEHAWKLDALVDLAEKHEQYIHLTIDNHGKASQSLYLGRSSGRDRGQHDHEWEHSPYNRDNRQDGGFLRYSKQLFSDEKARRHYRNKMRYIAARWGWSTHIYGIEMWSELDLIGHVQGRHRSVYGSHYVHKWHEEMTGYLRSQDHGNHVITTHYSGDFRFIDRELVRKPFIDYVACDAYHSPKQHLVDMLMETERVCVPFNKPFMVTEFGGDWSASNIESLTGDLYTGLWWGWMSGTAGTPMYWWFEYLELANLYPAYSALARFTEGEDKRRAPGEPPWRSHWSSGLTSDNNRHEPLRVMVAGDSRSFYAWIYDRATMHHLPRNKKLQPQYDGIRLKLFQLTPGRYEIETWDSWTGKKIDSYTATTGRDRSLTVALPRFRVHVAVKVRPHQAGSEKRR